MHLWFKIITLFLLTCLTQASIGQKIVDVRIFVDSKLIPIEQLTPDSAEKFLTTTLQNLQLDGYFDAQYDSIVRDSSRIDYHIKSGKKQAAKAHILVFEVSPDDTVIIGRIQKFRKLSGKKIPLKSLDNFENQILKKYLNTGYPFVQMQRKLHFESPELLLCRFFVDKGRAVRIDSLIVVSETPISAKRIMNYTGLRKNMLFSQEKIDAVADNLAMSRSLKLVRPPGLEFFEEHVRIFVPVKSLHKVHFDALLGIADKSGSNIPEITGFMHTKLINLLNRDEQFGLKWDKTQNGNQQVSGSLIFPSLLLTRFGGQIDFNLDKIDSSFLNTQIKNTLGWTINAGQQAGIQATWSNSLTNSDVAQTLKKVHYGIFYRANKLKPGYLPRVGHFLHFELSSGKISQKNSENQQAESAHFAKIEKYFQLKHQISLKTGIEIAGINSPVITANNSLMPGGIHSFRGISRGDIFTQHYVLTHLETLYFLGQQTTFSIFTQYFQYQSAQAQRQYSLGWSIYVPMKNGLLQLSMASAQNIDKLPVIKNSKIHLGVISRF